ncbi:Crp/Fnr family transcriptional regulator [Microseira wollei]|uniref:Transcriptional regulator, Crp/Fnr family protein n=1 Tax=Microseira wollei NIES-4236 TaxID=2530354 RepID=A0AAV3XM10_9CYAN|nr:Crp/Fnr family transcriptional regulator [Microseira wollei]GET43688.1 transcriptional regulator, Crp/Fnr family protein [Microseira wollei NIES-4236]
MLKQDSQLREFLSNIKLWRGLPAEQVEQLARIALAQTYAKGEIIFQAGDEGSGFFIVVSGRVKVYKTSPEGKEQILHLFVAGDHFAEVPAFDGQNFPASAMALETSELLFFPRTSFLNLLQEQPSLAIKILGVFARHLRIMAQLVEDLSLKEVPGRLATYLLYLSDRNNSSDLVELDMTKSQLAALLGTIPETLSRVFAKLSAEDIISTNGSKIKLLDRQRLIGLAGGLKI